MNQRTDQQLLRKYVECHSEGAFAELVRRHVDLVYSVALRLLRDRQEAEEITQGVFLALAQSAQKLINRPILCGWLHCTARNLATKAIRSDVRRRAREQEAFAMNDLAATQPDASWEEIHPHLDAVIGELDEAERDAVLMRYFQRKSAREMAQALGISDEAAQKRVSRAVERLRQIFVKRGVTAGASGLVAVVSANAVQAAPVGLATTISGTAATLLAATKILTMTTLQKTAIGATLVAAIGTSLLQTQRLSEASRKTEAALNLSEPMAEKIRELQSQLGESSGRIAAMQVENGQLRSNAAELLRLRAMAAQTRTSQENPGFRTATDLSDPFIQSLLTLAGRASELNKHLQQRPDKQIPELQLLTEDDWLKAAREAKFDSDREVRVALAHLRSLAKNRLPLGQALWAYAQANQELPKHIMELKPYLYSALREGPNLEDSTLDAILVRYKLLHAGKMDALDRKAWIAVEIAPVDKDHDSRAKFGRGQSTIMATGLKEAGDPDDPSY